MAKRWMAADVLGIMQGYQAACVLSAGADLGVFEVIAEGEKSGGFTAGEVAWKCEAGARGMEMLLDALTGLELLEKEGGKYRLAPGVLEALTPGKGGSVLAMVRHQGNCLRRWTQLAQVVKQGRPAERGASIRGEEADQASFIEAMNDISGPVAAKVVADLEPLEFTHVLDVGGASGTWALAFLRHHPQAKATIFDLPHVIPMAEKRLQSSGMRERVQLVAGDFTKDELPGGADLAWVSAIVHQQDRAANRKLFAAVFKALKPGGKIMIRDIVMNEAHTGPVSGTLFAINMLVATENGGTFSLAEFKEDLEKAGFKDVKQVREDAWMNAVVEANK